ncbi:hypothetical protein ACROYT_G015566 [Oculina patagonica]
MVLKYYLKCASSYGRNICITSDNRTETEENLAESLVIVKNRSPLPPVAICWSSADRHIGRLSSVCWLFVSRLSADNLPTGFASMLVNFRPTSVNVSISFCNISLSATECTLLYALEGEMLMALVSPLPINQEIIEHLRKSKWADGDISHVISSGRSSDNQVCAEENFAQFSNIRY